MNPVYIIFYTFQLFSVRCRPKYFTLNTSQTKYIVTLHRESYFCTFIFTKMLFNLFVSLWRTWRLYVWSFVTTVLRR